MSDLIVKQDKVTKENSYFLDFIQSLPKQSKEFIEEYEEMIKYGIVINDIVIDVNSNEWDLSELCIKPRKPSGYIYKFLNIKSEWVFLEKMFIINQLNTRGPHATVIRNYNNEINLFINCMLSINIQTCSELKMIHVKQAIDHRLKTVSYRGIANLKNPIKLFLKFISLIYKDVYTIDIENYLEDINTTKVDRIAKNNKTRILPTDFVNKLNDLLKNKINELLEKEIYYTDNEYSLFLVYSSIYILIQTGIRISELYLIPLYPIETIKLLNEEKELYYFHYNSTKNQSKKIRAISAPTHKEFAEYISKISNKIKNIRPLDLRKKYIFESGSFTTDDIRNQLYEISLCYSNELGTINNSEKWRFSNQKEIKTDFGMAILSIPAPRQFRKYWACDMKKRGYSDLEIMRWLGHIDEKMLGYYGETEEIVVDNIDFSKNTLRNILKKNDNILGPRGKQYQKDITEIAKQNSYKSTEEIIDQVLKQKQIRRKNGGFCCKPNIGRPCKFDSNTDRFYCAYEMCPNQCHMYYDLVYYLKEFEILKLTYNTNMENNQINASEKELYKIKNLIRAKLIPELVELDRKLLISKSEEIIEEYP